jgi:hypothetical protein
MHLKTIFLFILASLFFQLKIVAQERNSCPYTDGLTELKSAIDQRLRDSSITGYNWVHFDILSKVACADKTSDKQLQQARMQLMWQQYKNEPVAKDTTLTLKELLCYAVAKRYGPLLLEAANRWKLDLNAIDENRYQTVLDYLDEQINDADEKTKLMLNEYRTVLTNAGAKNRNEIAFRGSYIQKHYDRIGLYAYGLFPVQKKGKWGWVNHRNEIVIPLHYKAIRYFTGSLFEVSNDGKTYYYINRNNKRVKNPWKVVL